MAATDPPAPALLRRFSSRLERLGHVFLKDRLRGAREYRRIAGYFRSSIFELVDEELDGIERVQVVCNSDLDPRDVHASRLAREAMLKEKWNEGGPELDSLLFRPRYRRLYEILKSGHVEIKVVSREDTPFLHGKAGVIVQGDGAASAFIGSLNETREGWDQHYELVWEDTSPEGIAWVEAEFQHLWDRGKPLPDAIIEEIGRCARKREVELGELEPIDVAAAALVEAPLYRRGEDLKSWQRALVALAIEHREIYGCTRLLLADEVGLGKTLSLAAAAMVAALLEDGPVLVLCPATLCQQWQVELKDKLGIPSAVWLSARKAWQDPDGHLIRTRGPEDIRRCPYRIGIVSTGLIFRDSEERAQLLRARLGTLVLDEAHKARRSQGIGSDGEPNRLLSFMLEAARNARHVLLGTATPIQTDVAELWDALEILNQNADHVLGRMFGPWRQCRSILPVVTGEKPIEEEHEAWLLIRNPLPPRRQEPLFDYIRTDLGIADGVFFTDRPITDLDATTRTEVTDRLAGRERGTSFFQRHNPIVRHTVLRKRSALEDRGLLDRIAVDIWPMEGQHLPMFDGQALLTSPEIDAACEAAEAFGQALAARMRGTGFMRGMLLQRICSSLASGLATAERLLAKRPEAREEEQEDEGASLLAIGDVFGEERRQLEVIVELLNRRPTDPKLEAVTHFLVEKDWPNLGCIVFSQYHDTARWAAASLTKLLPEERVALYAGADRSGLFLAGNGGASSARISNAPCAIASSGSSSPRMQPARG